MNAAIAVLAALLIHASTAEPQPSGPVSIEVHDADGLIRAVAGLAGPNGGLIRLRPGAYVLDQPLRLVGVHCVTIQGGGWNTVLTRRGGGDLFIIEDAGFCVLRDLLLTASDHDGAGSGIVLRGQSSSNTIASCRIVDFPESGVRFEGDPAAPMSSNAVRNCHFIGNRSVQLHSIHNNDYYIVGNQFGTHSARPRVGCHLDHSSAGTYTLNYHWDNDVAFILGPGAHYNRIVDNRFEESRREGVRIGAEDATDACRLNIITGNTIHTNGKGTVGAHPAVRAWRAEDTIFSANQVFSWNADQTRHTAALVLDPACRDWIITGNTFRHHTDAALVLAGEGHVVRDNIGADSP